ncbi:hypothetical protein CDAR_436421, partial [Caerostris darwini]
KRNLIPKSSAVDECKRAISLDDSGDLDDLMGPDERNLRPFGNFKMYIFNKVILNRK